MGTVALCAVSVLIVAVLIVRRMAGEGEARRREAVRTHLSRFILAALKSPVTLDAKAMPPVVKADYPVLIGLVLDMLRSLRGADAHRIVELLRLWQVEAHIHTMAATDRTGKRIRALTLLGFFDDEASLSVLLAMAGDKEMYVQIAALRSLAQRGATAHIDEIADALGHSAQSNTQLLHDILQRFGPAAVPALVRLASSKARTEVRVAAVMALGSVGDIGAVPSLIVLAGDPSGDVRAQALAALGRIGDPRSIATAVLCLKDEDAGVRAQAVQALGALQAIKALPDLSARLNDSDWWVRFRAAEAIHRLGDRGIAALRALSRQPGEGGEVAAQALLEFGGVR
jgi:hypothetical protein